MNFRPGPRPGSVAVLDSIRGHLRDFGLAVQFADLVPFDRAGVLPQSFECASLSFGPERTGPAVVGLDGAGTFGHSGRSDVHVLDGLVV